MPVRYRTVLIVRSARAQGSKGPTLGRFARDRSAVRAPVKRRRRRRLDTSGPVPSRRRERLRARVAEGEPVRLNGSGDMARRRSTEPPRRFQPRSNPLPAARAVVAEIAEAKPSIALNERRSDPLCGCLLQAPRCPIVAKASDPLAGSASPLV
jgi:hypothetical protein